MEKETIIGVCGLACSECIKFKAEDCKGCRPNKVCPLPACAADRNISFCFECADFPCDKNYKKGPIVPELLDHWKG